MKLVKAVSLAFFFGMLYALQAVVTNRRTFYDEWLDLDVEDLRPSGLTETQKNFRKYMREKQRREDDWQQSLKSRFHAQPSFSSKMIMIQNSKRSAVGLD